ncbi:MAG: hypothetical protein AAGF71_08115 [Pseudomonadota bacterium]
MSKTRAAAENLRPYQRFDHVTNRHLQARKATLGPSERHRVLPQEQAKMMISPIAAAWPSAVGTAAQNLSFHQAVDVWLLHWRGEKSHEIAAKLATNPLRVDAVLNERQHVGSREKAQLMRPKG